jgi:hypothetical protein
MIAKTSNLGILGNNTVRHQPRASGSNPLTGSQFSGSFAFASTLIV